MNDEEDEFVYQKLLQLNSEKQRAISEEDFDEADRLK